MRENIPSNTEATAVSTGEGPVYPAPGHPRNLCLIWPDGRRFFLNYAYLVGGEFDPAHEKNVIRLSFSSHTANFQGYSLESLFMELLDHLPRFIFAIDERYVLAEDRNEAVVVEMSVEKKDT
ncbi:MAG: hypothetical protein EOP49_40925 [Sphingobacteriales bacterium]|nr:MAG: hypothetical protein EOP49_40925 [Sphingobacteriales bacterium]